MFLKVKKTKGIELGSFVVLSDNTKAHAEDNCWDSNFMINANMELGFVVSDNLMGMNEIVAVIPVIYDKNDARQNRNNKYLVGKRKIFHFFKRDLKLVNYNPNIIIESTMNHSSWYKDNLIGQIDDKHRLYNRMCGTLEDALGLWEGR